MRRTAPRPSRNELRKENGELYLATEKREKRKGITMIEWFNDLSNAEKIAVIAILVPVSLAVVKGLFVLFKWLFRKKNPPSTPVNKIDQPGSDNTAIIAVNNKGNIAAGDIKTGINEDVLNAALKALNTALSMVDTDQSKNLVSELKKISDEKLSTPIELVQDKHNDEQKPPLEKEFQLYGELWKALFDVQSTVVITPTLDCHQRDKSTFDVYKERYDIAVEAFNKANRLFNNHRPFYHDDISKITRNILSQCRRYIRNVGKMLSSEKKTAELFDEADELLEIIPKAIDEIEKAIKRRIGLLPKSETNDGVSVSLGRGLMEKITNGSITYKSNTLNHKPLIDLKTPIIGGYVKRNDDGQLEVYIQTEMPFRPLQRLNERLGLDSMHLFSESDIISEDSDNPTVFTSSTEHILPKGEMVLDLTTWQEVPFPMNYHVQTQTTASGHLKGKVFQGKFEAILTYHEIDLKVGLNGDFQVHLA